MYECHHYHSQQLLRPHFAIILNIFKHLGIMFFFKYLKIHKLAIIKVQPNKYPFFPYILSHVFMILSKASEFNREPNIYISNQICVNLSKMAFPFKGKTDVF